MRGKWSAGLGLAAAMLVAGCGGGEGEQPPAGGGGSSSGSATPVMQEPCKVTEGRVVVDIRETEYTCGDLTIPADTQVIWTNSDEVEHGVAKTAGPGADFNSGPIQPGGTFSQVLDEVGTYTIKDQEIKGGEGPQMKVSVEEKTEQRPAAPDQP